MEFPKNDLEIKAFGLLMEICRLESIPFSHHGIGNTQKENDIAKLKGQYYECVLSINKQKHDENRG